MSHFMQACLEQVGDVLSDGSTWNDGIDLALDQPLRHDSYFTQA